MRRNRSPSLRAALGIALAAFLLTASSASADPALDQARRMHDRLVGVPPEPGMLQDMRVLILAGGDGPEQAAELAMREPGFYNVVLKNWIKPWTNVERTVFVDLSDYVVTVIGLIRDEIDFRRVLSGDVVYVGDTSRPEVPDVPYSHFDNDHYVALEQDQVDLSDPDLLVSRPQSTLPLSQLTSTDAAGVLTTRAAGEAFFKDGTNRRMWRFTAINFLCRDMEQLKDVTRPADRIRQDVNRSPGGDSELFHEQCVGCHSGMDPMSGAFAYFEWDQTDDRVVHRNGFVADKYLINANTFPGGYITTNNRWDNLWRGGVNAVLGWRGTSSGGFGPQTLGVEVANSRAFSLCQVEKVFKEVCFRPPESDDDATAIRDIADDFELSGYRMKTVFAKVAVHCMGD